MRQQLLTKPSATHHSSINQYGQGKGKQSSGITITPLRGFFITLLFLGIPTVTLGTLCLSLVQNNLRLSEKNNELQAIATEVKAEVDSLGEEIDTLKERAGVAKEDQASKVTDKTVSSAEVDSSKALSSTSKDGIVANALQSKGGPADSVDSVTLLKDVQKQVPKLSKTLDTSIKPALEETLAEEAAYPDGQPVVGMVQVSSEFGIRGNPFSGAGYEMHSGIDFVGDVGDIVAATGNGTVTLAGPNGGYGNTVTIDHSYGYETLYAHMSEVKVNVGDTVKRGQIIGYVGSTGRSTGPHLHYELYKDDEAINPRTLMKLPENNLAQGPR